MPVNRSGLTEGLQCSKQVTDITCKGNVLEQGAYEIKQPEDIFHLGEQEERACRFQ